ncbi:MAG TPA: bifunctional demethylmenaquinone methyltransferase/2-methoxy-6-polyprenyl-1,4-benzoquinol methylase UbiE [Candidatus Elarobacter sp.]|jgi:demethylmenaquinone methyltransferase/2-methoxy-6-polyprenyl-1,4-benzoquinol methylase|nr:bifunctional demethylmenaquinone methyltransferase/2-methoxy-6-polyprenyl-1,4-benzoquinol methylase UbiE [Candidatus Elarobacter sp.]
MGGMVTDPAGKGAFVRDMFAAIAPRYDRANKVLTAGVDEAWRRRAVAELAAPPGGRVADLCCGTGDLAFHLLRTDAAMTVVGIDFTPPMLDGARARAPREDPGGRVTFVEGDVTRLPFEDGAFEGATMGFSMRNVVDVLATLREARRILRPGARFVNLDVTKPANPLVRRLFGAYFYGVVPLVGGVVGGSKTAYRYLPNSLTNFPDAARLAELFRAAGFGDVRTIRLGFGAIAIHVGTA